eukprot:g73.t1
MASLAEEVVSQNQDSGSNEVEDNSSATDTVKADTIAEENAAPAKPSGPKLFNSKGYLIPQAIYYCKKCELPLEYCQFSPFAEECAARLIRTRQRLLDSDIDFDDSALNCILKAGEPNAEDVDAANKDTRDDSEKSASTLRHERKRRREAIKRKEKQGKAVLDLATAKVDVLLSSRNKKKFITYIRGIETFGIDLKPAAKALGKRFACSCSVKKNEEKGKAFKEIVVQGDCTLDIKDVLGDLYKIPPKRIVIGQAEKKGKGKKKN